MLVVNNIKRRFGPIEAVSGISFTIGQGTVLGLLGPNGAGKTTTMRMILGIYSPDSGTISWKNSKIDTKVRQRFGYLPEERGLYGKMKVQDQIAYFGKLHGLNTRSAEEKAKKWMKELGIIEFAERPCSELSKGNQQKVQLASAVIHEPDLLVLDEPFSGLDPLNAEAMLECIKILRNKGTTLILSSHQMWQIENACDEFCIIDKGIIKSQGTLKELRTTFPTRKVRIAPDFLGIRNVFKAYGADEPIVEEQGKLIYELPVKTNFGRLLRESVAAGPLELFEREEPSLHNIYLKAINQSINKNGKLHE